MGDPTRLRFALALTATLLIANVAAAQPFQLVYDGTDHLPGVEIDGEPAVIHTQGLYVTAEHLLVTGRLERNPKRAMLLRFQRNKPDAVETLDITRTIDGRILDHPGGFDVDAEGRYWMPLSTSDANGPSLVCRFTITADQPLARCQLDAVFQVDDHIGAICRLENRIIGANWDTKRVYIWNADGTEHERIDRHQLFAADSEWALAVQDWKRLDRQGDHQIVAGGLDKSRDAPQATIQILDLFKRDVIQTFRFDELPDVTRPITNEGLAVFGDTLFLLPEDIGRGAKVIRFKMTGLSRQR